MSEQSEIRCVLMRGGTSKGVYLRAEDLPGPGVRRDALLRRLLGSPDVLQIDGLGGSRPITSKVAIVSASARTDADVDYTFAQVSIDSEHVSYLGNCGNISSGVGPFAVDEGLLEVDPASDGVQPVRIWNTNTEKLLVAHVPVAGGRARTTGDFAIAGVPGTGAAIVMDWSQTVGAKTGRLLPTGRPVDRIRLESGREIDATLCDAGNPALWVAASAVGLTGSEHPEAINANAELLRTVQELRGKAAVAAGLCQDWRRADVESVGVPLLGFVAPPADYTTLNGRAVSAAEMDLRVRLMFMNRLHESIAGTGSISLSAASRVKGSVVHGVATVRARDELRIGHPSGVMAVRVNGEEQSSAGSGDDPFRFRELSIVRTARRLMHGCALYPDFCV